MSNLTDQNGQIAARQAIGSLVPANPKRRPNGRENSTWYDYYAGYPDSFVREIVAALPSTTGTVLDPWNGSGTTTSIATRSGLGSVGFDINPAATVIAKARLLSSEVAESLAPLAEQVVALAQQPRPLLADDPLTWWFGPSTTDVIRRFERSVHTLLVSAENDERPLTASAISQVSSLAALFYLALFRAVRPLLRPYMGSNPTWVRRAKPTDRRRGVTFAHFASRFRSAVDGLAHIVAESGHGPSDEVASNISLASSVSLPLQDASVDAVITSPPYCTRIDYAISTLPELAVLGIAEPELAALRSGMVGTPTICASTASDQPDVGHRAQSLLDRIAAHESRAAHSYYLPFYAQYLSGMLASTEELARVVRPKSVAVLVAQDSYFKELLVDVPSLLVEMAEQQQWTLVAQHRFPVPASRNRAAIHRRAAVYRDSTSANESVLCFETP